MYVNKLSIKDTQKAIKFVKDRFEQLLSSSLNLDRVSAPLFVLANSKINDDLGINDSALKFHISSIDKEVEIVQSLAKWKRIALKNYDYQDGEGIYADMNAIRPLDLTDQLHSIYVDQWDWELVINDEQRNTKYLENTVKIIVNALAKANRELQIKYPTLTFKINENVFFITAEELLELYPDLNEQERENEITKLHKTVFIKEIGKRQKNNRVHSLRAFDYDDWSLNGDLLLYSDVLNKAVEVSSMGIRVNADSLIKQANLTNNKTDSLYHKQVINNTLPLTIGGGIGQSRICLLLLEKYHIAEVQSSIWSEADYHLFSTMNIKPL